MDDYIGKTIAVYDLVANEYAQKVEKFSPELERKLFCSMLPAHASILDAGCGSGRDAAYFTDKGFSVTGVDLSEKLLAIAKKRASKAIFLQQDLRSLQLERNSFDGIWVCASILHLQYKDVPSVLNKFYEILKPNGIVFISVKVGNGERIAIEPTIPMKGRFYAYYSKQRLQKLVEQAGFRIIDMYIWPDKERYHIDSSTRWISCFARKE